jgi:hypothetical protein
MRRLFVTVLLAGSFLFVRPAPAHAWLHWLDEYSGPGPFHSQFPLIQVRLICIGHGEGIERAGAEENNWKEALRRGVAAIGMGCSLLETGEDGKLTIKNAGVNAPRTSVNFEYAHHLESVANHLIYESDVDKTVIVEEFAGSVSHFFGAQRVAEVGASLGGMRISSPNQSTFETFWRPYGKAMVNVSPFAGLNGKWWRVLVLQSSLLVLPGFDAKDFNATPGTFHTGVEFLKSEAVMFDLSSVFYRR